MLIRASELAWSRVRSIFTSRLFVCLAQSSPLPAAKGRPFTKNKSVMAGENGVGMLTGVESSSTIEAPATGQMNVQARVYYESDRERRNIACGVKASDTIALACLWEARRSSWRRHGKRRSSQSIALAARKSMAWVCSAGGARGCRGWIETVCRRKGGAPKGGRLRIPPSDKSNREQKCRIWKRAMHMGTVYRARLFRQRSAYGPTLLVARRWGR